ncbi:MAG: hypothetical protein D6698_13690 [Gammaproteobacteria bacterium]|nr:MAG: hypothetical protein D6698_13690 [Gammaproteobacteria bacterium]
MTRLFLAIPVCLLGLLTACGTVSPPSQQGVAEDPLYSPCLAWFEQMDREVYSHGVHDAQYHAIPGLPYLRTNRFLSSFDPEILEQDRYRRWFQVLLQNDQEARFVEWQNLPISVSSALTPPVDMNPREAIRKCGTILGRQLVANPRIKKHLQSSKTVPDQYSSIKRLLGLYPLTALFFRRGIEHWQERVRLGYNRPISSIPVKGALIRYRPPDSAIKKFNPDIITDPLFPMLSQKQWRVLFDRFAPIWEVDAVDANDRIGRPGWSSERIQIDTTRPEIYYLPSLSRLNEQTLLQLNYFIWFPARPKTGALDLLGGHVDGLIFRVTLNQQGRILAYDSIHSCGCYYLLFPHQFKPPARQKGWAEPVLMPQQAPVPGVNERLVIRLSHRDHQIQRLYIDQADSDGNQYTLIPYERLRNLSENKDNEKARYRSMFDAKGLVRGTQRLERWFFWPMGIRSPGAMRQWGTHAIAFIGKRHFDDARLLEPYLDN